MEGTMTKKINLTVEQAATALERAVDRVDGKPRLKGAFVLVDVENDIGVYVDALAETLKEVQDPVPASLLAALDLPVASSYAVVAAVIRVMMNARIVQTPEEKAALDRDVALLDFVLSGDTAGRS
jgi:hypothetical protein